MRVLCHAQHEPVVLERLVDEHPEARRDPAHAHVEHRRMRVLAQLLRRAELLAIAELTVRGIPQIDVVPLAAAHHAEDHPGSVNRVHAVLGRPQQVPVVQRGLLPVGVCGRRRVHRLRIVHGVSVPTGSGAPALGVARARRGVYAADTDV